MREFLEDAGFVLKFLVFVFVAGIILPDKVLFYFLLLVLLSMVVVNADKLSGRLAWLGRV